MMFNITFAAGALISVPFMPLNGKSARLILVVACGYALVAAGYWLTSAVTRPGRVRVGRNRPR